jgi:hypothetical protein
MSANLAGFPPRYLRTPEASRFVGLSIRTLEKHRIYGTGPCYSKLGGRGWQGCQVIVAGEVFLMNRQSAAGVRDVGGDVGLRLYLPDGGFPGVAFLLSLRRRLVADRDRVAADALAGGANHSGTARWKAGRPLPGRPTLRGRPGDADGGHAGVAAGSGRGWPDDVIWPMVICGTGFGLFQLPNNCAFMASAPRERSGACAGVMTTSRLTGQTLGGLIESMG